MLEKAKIVVAAFLATGAAVTAVSAVAGELNPRQNTANLEYGDVLKIRLPLGLCEFEQVVPAYVVDQLSERKDWRKLVEYMLVNCPDLGLPLADTATASITEVEVDDSGDGSGGAGGSGSSGDTGTGGDTGSGGDTASDDDGNNGHGNDADGHDESNPGNG